jgi:sphingolipid delta-4 desaturase
MGQLITTHDFYHSYTDEPHATRRKEMLKKYPEIKQLMGHDWRMAIQVFITVFIQITVAILLRESSWLKIIICAYVIGGTINHTLSLALHELTHNLAFGHSRPMYNRLLDFFANLPLAVPASITLKKYHLDHHRFQGDAIYDTDVPTRLEVFLFSSRIGKLLFLIIMPFIYSFRPMFIFPKAIHVLEIINLIIAFTFDGLMFYFFGGKTLAYFLLSTFLGLSLHPISGHFIAEHYVFKEGHETYSYYGPLNAITFNVGYHNEHHDFPYIPGRNLPKVRKIAPEYYDNLPCYTSWTKVLYDFVMNDNVGPWSRVTRPTRIGRVPVPSQQEYEQQLKCAVNEADKQE